MIVLNLTEKEENAGAHVVDITHEGQSFITTQLTNDHCYHSLQQCANSPSKACSYVSRTTDTHLHVCLLEELAGKAVLKLKRSLESD